MPHIKQMEQKKRLFASPKLSALIVSTGECFPAGHHWYVETKICYLILLTSISTQMSHFKWLKLHPIKLCYLPSFLPDRMPHAGPLALVVVFITWTNTNQHPVGVEAVRLPNLRSFQWFCFICETEKVQPWALAKTSACCLACSTQSPVFTVSGLLGDGYS